jgi:hypothetical protein
VKVRQQSEVYAGLNGDGRAEPARRRCAGASPIFILLKGWQQREERCVIDYAPKASTQICIAFASDLSQCSSETTGSSSRGPAAAAAYQQHAEQ